MKTIISRRNQHGWWVVGVPVTATAEAWVVVLRSWVQPPCLARKNAGGGGGGGGELPLFSCIFKKFLSPSLEWYYAINSFENPQSVFWSLTSGHKCSQNAVKQNLQLMWIFHCGGGLGEGVAACALTTISSASLTGFSGSAPVAGLPPRWNLFNLKHSIIFSSISENKGTFKFLFLIIDIWMEWWTFLWKSFWKRRINWKKKKI